MCVKLVGFWQQPETCFVVCLLPSALRRQSETEAKSNWWATPEASVVKLDAHIVPPAARACSREPRRVWVIAYQKRALCFQWHYAPCTLQQISEDAYHNGVDGDICELACKDPGGELLLME